MKLIGHEERPDERLRAYLEHDHNVAWRALWERCEVAENNAATLSAQLAEARAVISRLYEWYDRDGSVGGASHVFEDNRAHTAAMRVGEKP